jgi:hypothetical protein
LRFPRGAGLAGKPPQDGSPSHPPKRDKLDGEAPYLLPHICGPKGYEILFCVASAKDTVIPLIESLMAEQPEADARPKQCGLCAQVFREHQVAANMSSATQKAGWDPRIITSLKRSPMPI